MHINPIVQKPVIWGQFTSVRVCCAHTHHTSKTCHTWLVYHRENVFKNKSVHTQTHNIPKAFHTWSVYTEKSAHIHMCLSLFQWVNPTWKFQPVNPFMLHCIIESTYFLNPVSPFCIMSAPGWMSQPLRTSCRIRSMLVLVTFSGYVITLATSIGTATWESSRWYAFNWTDTDFYLFASQSHHSTYHEDSTVLIHLTINITTIYYITIWRLLTLNYRSHIHILLQGYSDYLILISNSYKSSYMKPSELRSCVKFDVAVLGSRP